MRIWILGCLILGLMFWVPVTLAASVSEQQVSRAVETWLQQGLVENRPDAAVTRLQPHVVDGRTIAYIASIAGGGYCICGADDVLLPVYFYAPEGEFDPEIPDLQTMLANLTARLQWVEEGRSKEDNRLNPYVRELDDRAQEWLRLEAGLAGRSKSQSSEPELIKLPLTSEWHQDSPFDQYCPVYPDGGQTVVGCAATAMAQLMYYWQWPETGYSSHMAQNIYTHTDTWISTPLAVDPGITWYFMIDHLSWTPEGGGQLRILGSWDNSMRHAARRAYGESEGFIDAFELIYNQLTPGSSNHYANFAATSYNFELMEDAPTDPASPGAQAAALLSYHAGIAVDMNWGRSESVAGPQVMATALASFFRYDSDGVMADIDPDLIRQEILWSRPVFLIGTQEGGGSHVWVASGVDTTDPSIPLFWMNLGAESTTIGWYRLDNVPSGLTLDQKQISGLAPLGVVNFVGPSQGAGADGSPDNPFGDIMEALNDTPDNGTLIIKANTNEIWDTGGIIDRPVTIKSPRATISAAQ